MCATSICRSNRPCASSKSPIAAPRDRPAIETGDILVRIDDQPIDGIDALHRLLDAGRIGRRAELSLIRRDRQLTVSLVPTELAAV